MAKLWKDYSVKAHTKFTVDQLVTYLPTSSSHFAIPILTII